MTTKENVFEPSNCYPHAAELLSILRLHYSNDEVTNSNEILLRFSDCGGDHYVDYISTQILLTCLYFKVQF